jgi:uncharacterized membrane protein SpoIIM required for sporulation
VRSKPTRATFLLALLLIAAGLAIGAALPAAPGPRVQSPPPTVPSAGAEAGSPTSPGRTSALVTIAANNLRIGAQLVGGTLTLGIYSLLELVWVGISLGHLLRVALVAGMPPRELLLLTVPHSVIELPALALLGAVEFEAAAMAYRKLRYDTLGIAPGYWAGLGRRVALGFALVAVAALVEVFVTGSFTNG